MIKLLTIAAMTMPTVALSDHYKSVVCYDAAYKDCEVLNEYYFEPGIDVRGKSGTGLRHLVDSVLSFIGDGMRGVGGAIDSLAAEARRSGYTKFTATLSGPKGTATFTYHLEGGDWSISKETAKTNTKPNHGGRNKSGGRRPARDRSGK